MIFSLRTDIGKQTITLAFSLLIIIIIQFLNINVNTATYNFSYLKKIRQTRAQKAGESVRFRMEENFHFLDKLTFSVRI